MSEQALYVGIDPGASGGWAVLQDDGAICRIGKLSDRSAFMSAMSQLDDTFIVLEKVWATPQMGVTSAFTFGHNFGWLTGVLDACGREYREVTSQKWQRELGLIQAGRHIGQNDDKKNRNKAKAVELFPGQHITHATADALLIAEYCRRINREQ